MFLHLKKLEPPSSKDALCQVWLKLAQWFWKRRFLISSMLFHYFIIISPWKRVGPFFWTNLNPLHSGMLCAKFGWNWPSCSGEEDKNGKRLQTDRRTDGRTDRRRTTGDQKSSLELKIFPSPQHTSYKYVLL